MLYTKVKILYEGIYFYPHHHTRHDHYHRHHDHHHIHYHDHHHHTYNLHHTHNFICVVTTIIIIAFSIYDLNDNKLYQNITSDDIRGGS